MMESRIAKPITHEAFERAEISKGEILLKGSARLVGSDALQPIDLIREIVDAEPFALNNAVVERVLHLLVEVVVEAGVVGASVKVPELGTFDATGVDGKMVFRFYEGDQ